MELRHLRYFLAVAETLHFRRAAEALLVSQPAVSQQIRDLEAELGAPLFERVGRRVLLTEAGETYRRFARRAFAELESGRAALDELRNLRRGRLRIGALQTIVSGRLPDLLARFLTDHPDVVLIVRELAAGEIAAGVANGELDLGVTFIPPGQAGLEAEPLFAEEFVLIVGPDHRLAGRRRVRVADLKEIPLTLLPDGYFSRRAVDQAFAEAGVVPKVAIEMNVVGAILQTVARSGGATMLPSLAVDGTAPGLRTVRLTGPVPRRTVGLIRRAGSPPGAASAAFAALVCSTLRSGQAAPSDH